MKNIILVLAIVVISTVSFGQELVGARALGMGSAYSSVVDDATALRWNPGGLALIQKRTISGGFSRLYWGIDNDNIGQGFLGYAQKLANTGNVGIGWTNMFSNVYSENTIHLGYGYNMSKFVPESQQLGVGLTLNLLMNGYNESNFRNNPDETIPISESPLFNDGYNTMNVSVDFGVIYKPQKNIQTAFVLNNINQPDMSLTGTISDSKTPISGVLGFSYIYNDFLIPSIDMRFVNNNINDKNKFEYNLGIESWFKDKTFALRTGINSNEISFGGTYNIYSRPSFQINYAFLYPLSDLGKVSKTHRISITSEMPYRIKEPEVLNLAAVEVHTNVEDEALLGDKIRIYASFVHDGEKKAENVKVIACIEDPDGENHILQTRIIDKTSQGDSISVEWSYDCEMPGDHIVTFHVDDTGLKFPEIQGVIDETNEMDNSASTIFYVKPPATIAIDLEANSLQITKASIKRTEEPQVPMVFFKKESFSVDNRYDYMLQRVSERLAQNPDARLILRGFYSPSTESNDDDVAVSRANVVFRRLVMLSTNIDQILVDSTDYDKSRTLARETYAAPKDEEMITYENRRVELSVELAGDSEKMYEDIEFPKGIDRFTGAIDDIDFWYEMLQNNKHVLLLVEGLISSSEKSDATIGLRRADDIRRYLLSRMPDMDDRIYIYDKITDNASGGAKIMLISDGILYKPYESSITPTELSYSDRENKVIVEFSSDIDIKEHDIRIVDEDGDVVRTIARGTGAPKHEYSWDWTDDSGEILAPGQNYYAVGDIVNNRDIEAFAKSDPIDVQITEIVDIIENILIVNFSFDASKPISNYFETRLDMTARKFIEDAQLDNYTLSASVIGHTDIIGYKKRNKELSEERSLREYNNIKRYMKFLLGFDTDEQLSSWIKEHNAEFVHKGVGFAEPYEIRKQIAGSEIEVLVGDNNLPEGRNVNRRVVIEYKKEPK